jgi:hypothetical protein
MESKWLLGIGSALTVGAFIYYFSDDGKAVSAPSNSIPREKLLEVLRDLRKETVTAFVTVASFALNIKQSNPQVTEEDLKTILLEYSPLKDIIGKAEAKVYELHEVTQTQIKTAYETEFSADEDEENRAQYSPNRFTKFNNCFKAAQLCIALDQLKAVFQMHVA